MRAQGGAASVAGVFAVPREIKEAGCIARCSVSFCADADRERTIVLAKAAAESDQLRGRGEAEAIAIYATAFNQDPHFFKVWRTLQAYRDAFASGTSRLVMVPGEGFLDLLRNQPQPGPEPK